MPFRDLVGHRRLVELLSRSVERDSLPPSLIFSGPEGVGKRLAATAVAEAINCLRPERGRMFDACGRCPACRRIGRGVHPDVLGLGPDDSGSIKIEQAREIIDRAAYRPFEGRRRVVIVDPADALGVPAQNALLKTLEEPPSASIFILVTARPDALLPTVRSRCPRLRFGPLSPAEVAGVLIARHGMADEEARARAAVADGSLGRALATGTGDFAEVRAAALGVLRDAAGASGAGPPIRDGEPAGQEAAGLGLGRQRSRRPGRAPARAGIVAPGCSRSLSPRAGAGARERRPRSAARVAGTVGTAASGPCARLARWTGRSAPWNRTPARKSCSTGWPSRCELTARVFRPIRCV